MLTQPAGLSRPSQPERQSSLISCDEGFSFLQKKTASQEVENQKLTRANKVCCPCCTPPPTPQISLLSTDPTMSGVRGTSLTTGAPTLLMVSIRCVTSSTCSAGATQQEFRMIYFSWTCSVAFTRLTFNDELAVSICSLFLRMFGLFWLLLFISTVQCVLRSTSST